MEDDGDLPFDPRVVDLLDNEPNAWLEIPAFGAHPLELRHQGFRLPILRWSKWESWAPNIVQMIATARSIVSKLVPEISEVPRLSWELISSVSTEDGHWIEDAFGKVSDDQRQAFLYKGFMHLIDSAVRCPTFSDGPEIECLQYRYGTLAAAGQWLGEWASGNGEKILRQHAQRAGRRSGELRREPGKRAAVEVAIRSLMQTKDDRDIPGIIKQRGLASDRYARDILKVMSGKKWN